MAKETRDLSYKEKEKTKCFASISVGLGSLLLKYIREGVLLIVRIERQSVFVARILTLIFALYLIDLYLNPVYIF